MHFLLKISVSLTFFSAGEKKALIFSLFSIEDSTVVAMRGSAPATPDTFNL